MWSVGNGYGTGNGGISVLGIGTGQPIYVICPYWVSINDIIAGLDPGREPKLTIHESIGHGMGLGHAFIPTYTVNFMSQATNGGCELGYTFLPFQQDIYLNYIKSKIN